MSIDFNAIMDNASNVAYEGKNPFKEYYGLLRDLHQNIGKMGGYTTLLDGLAGKKEGIYPLPLGRVPQDGMALLQFKAGKIAIPGATSAAGIKTPVGLTNKENLPPVVQEAIHKWIPLLECVGEPTPLMFGLAGKIHHMGRIPKYIVVAFLSFNWKDSKHGPFAFRLEETIDYTMEVSELYNPMDLPSCKKGEQYDQEELKKGGVECPITSGLWLYGKLEGAYDQIANPDKYQNRNR